MLIDGAIFRHLKKKAAEEGRSLQATVNDLLRQALTRSPHPAFRLKLRGWEAREQPGVDLLDRDKLFDLMDGR